jgi:hypothetical protein
MTDHWFWKNLGDGVTACEPSADIEAAFHPLFAAAGNPADMAVFTRYESEGRLQCEVIAYFSPAAAEIARKFGAQPCMRPARAGLGSLAGDPRCWPVLFPESRD